MIIFIFPTIILLLKFIALIKGFPFHNHVKQMISSYIDYLNHLILAPAIFFANLIYAIPIQVDYILLSDQYYI